MSWYYAIVAIVIAAAIYKYIEYKGYALFCDIYTMFWNNNFRNVLPYFLDVMISG